MVLAFGFGWVVGFRLRNLASPKNSVAGFSDISLNLQSRPIFAASKSQSFKAFHIIDYAVDRYRHCESSIRVRFRLPRASANYMPYKGCNHTNLMIIRRKHYTAHWYWRHSNLKIAWPTHTSSAAGKQVRRAVLKTCRSAGTVRWQEAWPGTYKLNLGAVDMGRKYGRCLVNKSLHLTLATELSFFCDDYSDNALIGFWCAVRWLELDDLVASQKIL